MDTLNKPEFIALVAGKAGTTHKDTGVILDATLAVITEQLSKGVDIPFIGFGTFKAVKKPERMGRNPGTGQTIKIAATTAVSFKVGAKLKDAVAGTKSEKK